jgi:hypothetical protein
MKNTTLDYIKLVLQKVSFDKKLFEKELQKAVRILVPTDISDLRLWCYEQFSDQYSPVLQHCFG